MKIKNINNKIVPLILAMFFLASNLQIFATDNAKEKYTEIVIINGEKTPDALLALDYAAFNPSVRIVFSNGPKKNVLNTIKMAKSSNSLKKVTIIGGSSSISKDLETSIKNIDIHVDRIAGANRYLSSVALSKRIQFKDKILVKNQSTVKKVLSGNYLKKNKVAIFIEQKFRFDKNSESMIKKAISSIVIADKSVDAPDIEVSDNINSPESQTLNISNMTDKNSIQYVTENLKKEISPKNVDKYMSFVKEYNNTIENASLNKSFETTKPKQYDSEKISILWEKKEGDFPGTNCRINVFNLLKDDIIPNKVTVDTGLLFIDHDAINRKNIYSTDDLKKFDELFSRVKSEKTTDNHIHAKYMEDHMNNFRYKNPNAHLLTVIIHDNLDGDYLFIGHTGAMVKTDDGKYLFVEKLSFDDPYQALKFNTKDEVYDYLAKTYAKFADPTSAKPFIMDNNQIVRYVK